MDMGLNPGDGCDLRSGGHPIDSSRHGEYAAGSLHGHLSNQTSSDFAHRSASRAHRLAGGLRLASRSRSAPQQTLNDELLCGVQWRNQPLPIFSLLYIVVDLWRSRWWTIPPLILGTNAILAFVFSGVITASTDSILMNNKETLHAWVYGHLFAPLLAPRNASLAYAVTMVLLTITDILPLYRKRIFLRI